LIVLLKALYKNSKLTSILKFNLLYTSDSRHKSARPENVQIFVPDILFCYSIDGLFAGLIVTPHSYIHLSGSSEMNSLPLSVLTDELPNIIDDESRLAAF